MNTSFERTIKEQLFIDALSEPFQPPTDPGKSHNLNRLAAAARSKGDVRMSVNMHGILVCEYEPISWAPGVRAIAYYTRYFRHMEHLAGINLEHDEAGELGVYRPSPYLNPDFDLLVVSDVCSEGFDLALGDPITKARAAVTEAAQSFFDAVPLPE